MATKHPGGVFEYSEIKSIKDIWGRVWTGLDGVLDAGGVQVNAGSMGKPLSEKPAKTCHQSTAEQVMANPQRYTPFVGFYFLAGKMVFPLQHSFFFDKERGKFRNACPVKESIGIYAGFAVSWDVFREAQEHGMQDPLDAIFANSDSHAIKVFAKNERSKVFGIMQQRRLRRSKRPRSRSHTRSQSRSQSGSRSRSHGRGVTSRA